MPVGQAHRQRRRVLTGVGGVHLVSRNLRCVATQQALRQAHGLRLALLQVAGKRVSGHGDDQPATNEGRPQPIEVLVTGQIGRLERRTDLRAEGSVVAGEGRGRGEKTLQLGSGREGRRHLDRLGGTTSYILGPGARRLVVRRPAHSAHRSVSGCRCRGITTQCMPDQSRFLEDSL